MTNDYNIISHFGDINILKFPHHGFGDISINNLRKLKPAHIIISSDYIYSKTFKLIKYMKNKYESKIYILKDIKKMAIKLYLNTNYIKNYYFDENDTTEKIMQNKLSESNKSKLSFSIILKISLLKFKNKSKDLKIFLFALLLITIFIILKIRSLRRKS
jgi:hypothetical protein